MQRILVTGAAGFIGGALVPALAQLPDIRVCGVDIRPPLLPQAEFHQLDLRDGAGLGRLFQSLKPTCVVHLASIVTPPTGMSRAEMRDIDVGATETLVRLCVEHHVEHLTVTTSGAAYGYHPDNPAWIDEETAIRGNVEFAYSDHKRQIEELLAKTRAAHPELKLLILRPGTILGRTVSNQITALFAKPRVLGVAGSESPFVFIWDEDVVRILVQGATRQATGAFNLAGDGALSMREIALRLNKPYLPIPAWLLRGILTVLHPLGLIQYGPEQVGFLQYRPVLANIRLKRDFGYTPQMSSAEAFAALLEAQPELVRTR